MFAFVSTSRRVIFGFCAIAACPLAMAQATLKLSTSPPPFVAANCVATTDSSGLILSGDGSAFLATGVTFSGVGCVPAGQGTSNFGVAVSINPSSVVAGTSANVTWSATSTATQCIYAGSTPAGATLAGWPLGATACSSAAACGTSHTVAVTPSSSGSYSVNVVCTNASGYAAASLAASAPPLPPQPINFALTTSPPSPTAGVPFNVDWNVTGATSCTGTASIVGGGSVNLPGWNTVFTTQHPRTVTAAVAGTYNLSLSCSNAAGTTSSQTAAVTVNSAAGACYGPAGLTRQTAGSVQYIAKPGAVVRDLTRYSEIWGYTSPAGINSGAPWPGLQSSSPIITNFGRTNYIAAQFTVPQGVSQNWAGYISHTTYSYGIDVTVAISPTCGDFSGSSQCVNDGAAGRAFPAWATSPTSLKCILSPGTYFINIKATDPGQSTSTCSSSSSICPLGTANNLSLR